MIRYPEVKTLLALSFLEQTSTFLSLDIDNPWNSKLTYDLSRYFIGAAVGLVVLALYSDCFIKQHMLFLPILFVNMLQVVFFLVCLIYCTIIADISNPNQMIIAIEGFFSSQAQFYLLFLTPLRVADKYRLTQEVTPAGTIIATNLCLTGLMTAYARSLILKL